MFGSWFSDDNAQDDVLDDVAVKRSAVLISSISAAETQSRYAEQALDILREQAIEVSDDEKEESEKEPPLEEDPDVEDYDQSGDDDGEGDTMEEEDEDKERDYLHPNRANSHPYESERPWARPKRENNIHSTDFVFQHTETSYGIEQGEPVLKIWGVNEKGNSVVVLTRNFKPYFYVDVEGHYDMEALEERMEAHLRQLKWKDKLDRYILKTERVQKRSICGYHRNQPLRTMYKVTVAQPGYVATLRDCLEKVNRAVTDHYIRTFEGNVPFELRAMVDSGLAGCQWIRLKANTFRSIASTIKGGMQYTLEPANGLLGVDPIPISEMEALAPMRYLSFDIECKRKKPGFCKAEEDPCILIAAALDVVGTGIIHKVVFALVEPGQTVNPIEGATVYVFHREEDMLMAFRQYVIECDPEAFTGWNITGFDWPYLFGRAKALRIFDKFVRFTRVPGKKAWMRQQTFKSKAHGARSNNELLCEGRFDYDGLVFMLRGQMTKFRSYKLNAICKEVLDGKQKVEVGYQQIPALHEGSDEDRTRLSHYCMVDALLPLELLNVLMAVINGIEQSRVTGVPIKWLLSRGQGVKTFSNILRYKLPDETFPSRFPKTNNVYTAGGYVREPIRGYYAHPLATLDFSSLYPSIMQAFNICYSTVESLAWAQANLTKDDYWIVPPLDGKTPNDFVFVKKHIREGILPTLLTALLGQRAYVKNLMKKVDPITQKTYYNVLDGRQLALKVVCNSVYGFLKAFVAPEPRLMAAVTAWGRDMIIDTATTIETHFKDNMIVDKEACEALGMDYEEEPSSVGDDSVTATTPVLIRYPNNVLDYVNIEDVPRQSEWIPYDNSEKEYALPENGICIWSDAGFTPLERIIRHKCQKDIFRILTHTGCVSVTSDHSLLRPNGDEVRPVDITVGDLLMHSELPLPSVSVLDADAEKGAIRRIRCYYSMGLFYGDGSCGRYNVGTRDVKSSWAINNLNLDFLRRAQDELNREYPQFTFKILQTVESSGVYKLVCTGEGMHLFVKRWRELFYTARKQKRVPSEILNASLENVNLFMHGYYDADGDKDSNGYRRFDNKGEIGAAALLFLSHRQGYQCSINNRKDKPDIYRVTCSKNKQRKIGNAIKRIENFGKTDEYVYDLQTANHHFAAGVGKIIVHNTDSRAAIDPRPRKKYSARIIYGVSCLYSAISFMLTFVGRTRIVSLSILDPLDCKTLLVMVVKQQLFARHACKHPTLSLLNRSSCAHST